MCRRSVFISFGLARHRRFVMQICLFPNVFTSNVMPRGFTRSIRSLTMNPSIILTAALFASLSMSGSVFAQDRSAPADSVVLHGKIYTVNEKQPWVQALAIRDGRLSQQVPNRKLRRFAGRRRKSSTPATAWCFQAS